MWTADNRPRYNRDKLRYPSDLTDPRGMGAYRAADPAGQARRRQTARRYPRGVNGVMYILSTGCQWRALPKDGRLPPRSTVHDYLGLWNYASSGSKLNGRK